MKRGRKPSTKPETKPEVTPDGNKPKKIKSSDEVKSNDPHDKIASLPLHGEYLPSKGYSLVPNTVKDTRQSLVEVFQMVRNQKRQGDKCSAADIEESRSKGALLFATLKKLNRMSHLYCKEARDKTLESKQELDALHLQLQNLKYETVHLSKEISNCLQFQSSHDDIQLINEEEFYDSAPAEISQPDVTKSNDHERMMARLHWELKQRQDLMSQKNTLQTERSSLEADISQQQSVIDNLKPSLDKLLEASLPIQEYLNLPLDKKRREHSISHLLPSPLYILYSQASAFSEAYDATNMKVSIQGDEEEARSFVEQRPGDSEHQSDDESDSDMDTKGEDSRRKSQSKSSVSEMKAVVKPHPLFIQIDINQSDNCTISLAIRYIPLVGVACVSVSGLDGNGDDCCLLDADTIFHELLQAGDDGEDLPSPLPHYLIKQLGEKVLMAELKLFGIPYQWVQLLCGLDFLSGSSSTPVVDVTQKNIHKIIKAIKERINVRSSLQNEINKMIVSLEGGQPIDAGPDSQHLFPSSHHSKMTRFKKLSYEEASAHSVKFDSGIFDVQNKAHKFFLVSFQLSEEQKPSHCRLHCLMCIRPTYPTVPPTFTLVLESQGQKKPQNHWIKAIEAEVNVHYTDLLAGDGPDQYKFLLARQLQKIQLCFDSLESTYPSNPREALIPHSMFSRKYCGHDRMPAYQYSSEEGLFTHRT